MQVSKSWPLAYHPPHWIWRHPAQHCSQTPLAVQQQRRLAAVAVEVCGAAVLQPAAASTAAAVMVLLWQAVLQGVEG